MPAHTSHILQPLEVSRSGPLKKAYGSQIENEMRLSINHITKEEFLPAFFAAQKQVMTAVTITSGFRATGLVPLDPERVWDKLGPIVEATPSPRSSQASWDPKTPRALPEIKMQSQLVLTENRKRRRSSASSADKPFQQLLRGFESVVHEKALLMAEVAALQAENQHQKRRRTRKKGYIQQGGSMTMQDGQDSTQKPVTREQPKDDENIDPVLLTWPLRSARKIVGLRCSKCGSSKNSAKFCSSLRN
jgi:hypothetical protein